MFIGVRSSIKETKFKKNVEFICSVDHFLKEKKKKIIDFFAKPDVSSNF